MSQLSKILWRAITPSGVEILSFKCPGCNQVHAIPVTGSAAWGWNGNADKPTFTPSILVRSGHFASHYKKGDSCWCTDNEELAAGASRFTCGICHSFVKDGSIQFLGDCTHKLAGQTVDIPDWPLDE